MQAIELTQEQRDKLLEMCVKLFPEYKSIQFGVTQVFLPLNGLGLIVNVQHILFHVNGTKYETFHWFEFCFLHVFPKVQNILNAEQLSNFYYITIGYYEKSNKNKNFEFKRFIHPIDYLYSEFKKLKL